MATSITSEMKSQKSLLFAVAGLAVVVILGMSVLKGNTSVKLPYVSDSSTTGNSTTTTTTSTVNGNNKYSTAPVMALKQNVNYFAVVATNYGNFTIDLFETNTPFTVNNFVFLAKDSYYNGLSFHRVVKGTLIQGGDPLANSQGGPGYRFKDEIDAAALGLDKIKVKDATFLSGLYNSADPATTVFGTSNLTAKAEWSLQDFYERDLGYVYSTGYGTTKFAPYVVAMANGGPNTNGSQFFITTKGFNNPSLDGRYTIFGRVSAGYDTIDKIESLSLDTNGKPTMPVSITGISILDN